MATAVKPLEEEFSDYDDSEDPSSHGDVNGLDDVPRRCTDPWWVLGLAVCCGFLGSYARMHFLNDDLVHFVHMEDWSGQACGMGRAADKPYLFFCPTSDGSLDFLHTICRKSCPNSTETSIMCPCDIDSYHPEEIAYNPKQDYPSRVHEGMVCKPLNPVLAADVDKWLRRRSIVALVSQAVRNWHLLAMSGTISASVSFAYLTALRRWTGYLVWFASCLFVLSCLSAGAWLLLVCTHKGNCPANEQPFYFPMGVVSLAVGVVVMTRMCRLQEQIDEAIECIMWACSFVMHNAAMLLVPVGCLTARLLVVLIMRKGFIQLISCFYRNMVVTNPLTFREAVYVVSWVVIFYWIQQTVTAFVDFITVFSTRLWYDRGGMSNPRAAPHSVACTALWTAVRYHSGSLIYSGLVFGITHPLDGWFPVLCPCMTSTKVPVYCEMAGSGQPFRTASERALKEKAEHQERYKSVHILNGAIFIFKVAGVAGAASSSHVSVWSFVTWRNEYKDQADTNYISNLIFFCFCVTSVAAVVAVPFMSLLDTVSDTIIHCHALELGRQTDELAELPQEPSWQEYARDRLGFYCGFRPKVLDSFLGPVSPAEAAEVAAGGESPEALPVDGDLSSPVSRRGSRT